MEEKGKKTLKNILIYKNKIPENPRTYNQTEPDCPLL